jgi:hypothetical protein
MKAEVSSQDLIQGMANSDGISLSACGRSCVEDRSRFSKALSGGVADDGKRCIVGAQKEQVFGLRLV